MLSASVERVGNTSVLHCAGQIVVGERLSALRDIVLCELDKHTIFLDLSRVDRIDAGGLGLLVFLHTSVNGLGTSLKLLSPFGPGYGGSQADQTGFGVHALSGCRYRFRAAALGGRALRSLRLTHSCLEDRGITRVDLRILKATNGVQAMTERRPIKAWRKCSPFVERGSP
jgi:ABC-type transporter Mla MlaB component